jgi:enolase
MNKKIKKINARHILDSRANPTIEVEVTTSDNIKGRAAVPSGASTGALEAHELRDNDPSFNGMGVNKAIENVKTIISDTLIGEDVTDQSNIDDKLIELDGTDNKNNLGANAILAVSMASMRASANQQNKQLFELFPNIYGLPSLPVPFMNILNGGAHADNSVDIQEFMIVPFGFETFDTSLRAGVEIYHVLKKRLKSNKLSTNVGDEGGFAPNFNTSTEILDEIMQSISEAGYEPGRNVSLALDVAASEFFTDDFYRIEGNELNSQEMSDYLINLTSNYPIISIEDGLAEDDWDGWKYLTEKIGDTIQLVGDDLFVTQEKILEKGVADSCANSILVKVNQVGSVSETINTMTLAKDSNYSSIVSHRSGETEDTFISHLCVGTSSGQIKTGAPARSERTAKYNELLRIGEKIGFEQFNIQELGYSK